MRLLQRLGLNNHSVIIDDDDPRGNVANKIYNIVRSNKGLDNDNIATIAELSEITIRPHLKNLRDAGKIFKGKGNKWYATKDDPQVWRVLCLVLVMYWLLPLTPFDNQIQTTIFSLLIIITIFISINGK